MDRKECPSDKIVNESAVCNLYLLDGLYQIQSNFIQFYKGGFKYQRDNQGRCQISDKGWVLGIRY